jgi:hypothetical protein
MIARIRRKPRTSHMPDLPQTSRRTPKHRRSSRVQGEDAPAGGITIERYRPAINSKTAHDSLFWPPPLLEDENAASYEELSRRVFEFFKPHDVIEELLVRDYVDYTWHLFRLRKYETENFEGVVNPDAVKPYTRDFGTHAPVIKFPDCLENVQVLNHLAADLEQRRNAISREIGYHRTIFKPLLSVKEITHE